MTVGAIYTDRSIVAQNSDGHYLVADEVFRTFPGHSQFLFRVDVAAADGVEVEQLRPVVEQAAEEFPAATVRDVEEIKEENNRQIQQSLQIFFALFGLALVIGALGVTITLAPSVFERTREIGLLRAVGGTRWQMGSSIRVEAILLTLLGTTVGLVLGLAGGSAIMRSQRDAFDTLRIAIEPSLIIGVLVLSIVIGVTASVVPAFRASRMDVLRAVTVE